MFRNWFSRRRRYDDLSVSIQEHLEEKVEELIESGLSRKTAEQMARREFGNPTLIEENSREIWEWPAIANLWADTKFALRQLIHEPGFTITAVLTLSLGIAVNATMFSLVSAFLMPHLPGRDPQHMVIVSAVDPNSQFLPDTNPVSAPNYLAWRTDRVFQEMAAADEYRSGSLTGLGAPEPVDYAAVSPNYFGVFGSSALFGRTFTRDQDQSGREHVVILGQGLWERRFASDPSIIGKTIRIDREDYVVIGVMPKNFELLGFTPKLWIPLVLKPADQTAEARKQHSLFLFARLAPGVTLEQARAEMNVLATRAERDFPTVEKHWGAAVRMLGDFLVYSFGIRTALAVLMTTVGFVLLIACANVAGLLLARATSRQKELAIRVSLGAGRARIVRQLLTEGLMIGLLGGAAGLVFAYAGIAILRAGLNFNEAMSAVSVRLDTRVLLFALAISVLSAILASVVPALKASRADANTGLKSESRTSSAGRSHTRLRTVLVSCEIALALFLLTGTTVLIRAVYLLDHQALGFRTERLLTAGISLDQKQYPDAARQLRFAKRLIQNLREIPGVESAAVGSDLPSTGGGRIPFTIEGEVQSQNTPQRLTMDIVATPDYFRAAGLPLLRGRAFDETDDSAARRVVLVNEELVHRYFQHPDPLGKRIQLDVSGAAPAWVEIIGIVGNVKSYSEDTRVDPEVYEPFYQRPVASFSVMMRSNGRPEDLASSLREAVGRLDAELPLAHVMSMQAVVERQRNGNPLFAKILGTFAVLALILASVGIYGLVAYSVNQRAHEIGIRIALGASSSGILGMIVRQGLKMAAIGLAAGFLCALPLPKLFEAIFAGLHFESPIVYPAVLFTVCLVAMVATYVPARRASRVDPTIALRNE